MAANIQVKNGLAVMGPMRKMPAAAAANNEVNLCLCHLWDCITGLAMRLLITVLALSNACPPSPASHVLT